jgi:hypothetical protein
MTDDGEVATMPDPASYPALKYLITIEVVLRRVHRTPAEPKMKAQLNVGRVTLLGTYAAQRSSVEGM